MKISTYIILLHLLIPISIFGQTSNNKLGIEIGLMRIDGDIDSRITDGYSLGLTYEQNLNSYFNLELNYYLSKSTGLEKSNSLYNPYTEIPWFANNKATIQNLALALGVRKNISDNLELRIQYGLGLMTYSNRMNVLNELEQPYNDIVEIATIPGDRGGYNEDIIRNTLDQTFETKGFLKKGIFGNDNRQFYLSHNLSFRISYSLNPKWCLAIKSDVTLTNNDYIDGVKYRTELNRTNTNDIIQRISISSIHSIGKSKKKK